MDAADPKVTRLLTGVFGHGGFRLGQEEIVSSVLSGRPTLAVMPTGAGKSLCYQLPALLFEGMTVVVSPLIALIRDQVGALKNKGVAAEMITSADSEESRRQVLRDVRGGQVKLLYVAPERFRSGAALDALSSRVSLLAIDEAHCISTWGHDFRPDYARLGDVIADLKPERIVALTATATPEVRADILRNLRLEDAKVVVTGFDRPNLELSVIDAKSVSKKLEATQQVIERWIGRKKPRQGTAIVYVATRKRAEDVAAGLGGGLNAAAYHAGLTSERRDKVQRSFERGTIDVVVATTAFGMGVDKANVRVVVHFDVPYSPEGYYQEVGRAGRDGEPAAGVLLYDPADLRFAYTRLEASCPTADAVERAIDRLSAWSGGGGGIGAGLEETADRLEPDVGPAARAALVTLERIGAINILPGEIEVRSTRPPIDREALQRRARLEKSKLDAMVGYVQRAACRRRYLTDYFGDPHAPERCGSCDRCRLPSARALEGEARTDALKALSCVARMKGRYGKGKVVDTLIGSRSKQILDAGLDQLSTYGLLSHYAKEEVVALLDSLARADLITTTVDEYPKLRLTTKGVETLKNQAPICLDLRTFRWGDRPARPAASRAAAAPVLEMEAEDAAIDHGLLQAFKVWRSGAASKLGKPAFVVAHDRTLEALASLQPATLDELSEVPGIGPAKLEKYGEELLAVVRAHQGREA